jgi:hypothetical protein
VGAPPRRSTLPGLAAPRGRSATASPWLPVSVSTALQPVGRVTWSGRRSRRSLDVAVSESACDGDTVTAVDHVIALQSLDHGDRRQGSPGAVGERNPFPAPPHLLRRGTEAVVEVRRRLERARDRAERDDLQIRRSRGQRCCAGKHLRSSLNAPPQAGQARHTGEGTAPPGTAKVVLGVYHRHSCGEAAEAKHCSTVRAASSSLLNKPGIRPASHWASRGRDSSAHDPAGAPVLPAPTQSKGASPVNRIMVKRR